MLAPINRSIHIADKPYIIKDLWAVTTRSGWQKQSCNARKAGFRCISVKHGIHGIINNNVQIGFILTDRAKLILKDSSCHIIYMLGVKESLLYWCSFLQWHFQHLKATQEDIRQWCITLVLCCYRVLVPITSTPMLMSMSTCTVLHLLQFGKKTCWWYHIQELTLHAWDGIPWRIHLKISLSVKWCLTYDQ